MDNEITVYVPMDNGGFWSGRYKLGYNISPTGRYYESSSLRNMTIEFEVTKWKYFKKLVWIAEMWITIDENKYYNCRR